MSGEGVTPSASKQVDPKEEETQEGIGRRATLTGSSNGTDSRTEQHPVGDKRRSGDFGDRDAPPVLSVLDGEGPDLGRNAMRGPVSDELAGRFERGKP